MSAEPSLLIARLSLFLSLFVCEKRKYGVRQRKRRYGPGVQFPCYIAALVSLYSSVAH